MSHKIVIFDVDGVLVLPTEPFSWKYAREHNLNRKDFQAFFHGDFQDALIGKADLKQLISDENDLWKWEGSVDELLQCWFEFENVPNEPLQQIIPLLREKNIHCYFATNQEKYRAKYMTDHMLKGMFDSGFISAQMGVKKPDPEFFKMMQTELESKHGYIEPAEILYFDDTAEHVNAANKLGIDAYLYQTQEDAMNILDLLI